MATQLSSSSDATTFFPVVMGNKHLMSWWSAGKLKAIELERNFSKSMLVLKFKFNTGTIYNLEIGDDRWLDGDVRLKDQEIATLYMFIDDTGVSSNAKSAGV